MSFAGCGTMKRECDSYRRRDTHRSILGLGRLERYDAVTPDDRDVGALAAFFGNVGKNGARLPDEAHMMDVTTAEVQALDAEAVIFGGFVLLDVTARFERREQTKDVVLMELEPFGEFRHAEFIDVAEELFEHVERMRDGLNYVVGFIASNHFFQ